jgi:hypothetical protein
MDTPFTSSEEMTDEAYEDLVAEMYWAIREEAPLYEVPLGVTDHLSTGSVPHGPWRPQDCARILLQWHIGGLLGLYRYTPTRDNGEFLTSTEVGEILSAPEAWVMYEDWTRVTALVITDKGEATDYTEWMRMAERA